MNWSDDENIILNQPSRDLPSSESEEEDYTQIIMKTQNININIYEKTENKQPVNKKQKNNTKVNNTLLFFNSNNKNERKFNPRLPPPAKYKK